MFEEWGLPFWYDDDGEIRARRPLAGDDPRGGLQAHRFRSHQEGPRPPDNHYERVFISHLFTDADDSNRIAGAVGFGVREDVIYVFKAKSVVCGAGGSDSPVPSPQRG